MTSQEKLIRLYEDAEKKLKAIILDKKSHGSVITYHRSLLRQVQQELKRLKKSTSETVGQLVKENYEKGLTELTAELQANGIELQEKDAAVLMMSGLNKSQIRIIAENTDYDFHRAIRLVGRRISDGIREAALEATGEKLTTGQTVRQMQKNLEQMLRSQNLTAIEYSNGSRMPLRSYAEMVSRSTTAETQNTAKLTQGQDWGYDLVQMTTHSPTCAVCAMYQGRIYALTREAANGKYRLKDGKILRFPYLYDTAFADGYCTIHPNCRHRISIFPIRAYTDDELLHYHNVSNTPFEDTRSDQERKAYSAAVAKRRRLLENRRQYERIKAALPDQAPKSFSGFMRMKLTHSERYQNLVRDYRYISRVAKQQENSIIKNIELPAEINKITSMSDETKKQISDAIDKLSNEYDIHLSDLVVKPLSQSESKVPFQYQPYFDSGNLLHRLVINQNYYFNDSQEEFQARILRNYGNGVLASKTVEDLISHELAHIMTFQDINSQGALLLRNKQLMKCCYPGVSLYADRSLDGAETIAEGFVRIRNGENVPDEVSSLVAEYIERWKK